MTAAKQRTAKAFKPTKKCQVKFADIPNMVDAVFAPNHERPGWIIMATNAKGREHVAALFPQAHIEWGDQPGFPDDWRGFEINLPGVVSAIETKLPLDDIIPLGGDIDDCDQDELAVLLAFGVARDGGRAATINYTKGRLSSFNVFYPPEN